jgi:predicted alpha/beta-fold hydrolase
VHSTPFKPHPLLPGGQLQTLAGTLFGSPPSLCPRAETIGLPDGDQLLLHVDEPEVGPRGRPGEKRSPLVLLLHGLGGCSESSYLLRLAAKLTGRGFTALRFNHRGCGPGARALARRIYHAGRVEDLAAAVAHVERRWPGRELAIVAFSLSANMLLRYLGEAGDASPSPQLRRVMAVCPPIDLELCSQALAAPGNWHIDGYYTRLLLATARDGARHFPELRLPPYTGRMNLRRFDEVYTAPKAGFPSRAAYYTAASARPVAHRLQSVPVTVLAAADDPIIPLRTYADLRWGASVDFRLERAGGHMGFISATRTRFGDRRWMDAAVMDWLEG